MNKTMIKLTDVIKKYSGSNSVTALNQINLTIDKPLMVAITGPSGSGKSTLLHIIGGMDKPTSGTVKVFDSELGQMSEKDLTRYRLKKVGFVFQSFNLIPNLTALENVMLPLEFSGLPTLEREKKATHLLEQVGLKQRVHHNPTELSGGEMQRVAIARALANDPALILADEPTGNLDSASGQQVFNFLKEVSKERIVIVVTHNEELTRKADMVFHMRDGTLV